jgi:hypothetical protein
MDAEGLVTMKGGIRLTDDGLGLAERVVRRHRLAERFLTDVLDLSWAEAHAEAGRWEHVISDRVETALVKLLGEPTTCPHGNPIPGTSYEAPDTVALTDLGVGAAFTVSRIPEELEFALGCSSSSRTPPRTGPRGRSRRRRPTAPPPSRSTASTSASASSPASASSSPGLTDPFRARPEGHVLARSRDRTG